MKKALALILSVCLILALVSGCGGKGAPTPAPAASSAPAASAAPAASSAPAASTAPQKSARDQVYEIIDKYPIAFNGIPPKQIKDRSAIVKALPLKEKKDIKDVTVAYVTGSVGSPFFTTLLNIMQEKIEELGCKFIYQVSNFNNEIAIQMLDAYIAQDVDIILANANVQVCMPTFKKAAEAGIPVVSTSNQPVAYDANVITDILAGSYKAGFYVGEYTAKQLYTKGTVLDLGFVVIQFGSGDTESRGNGFVGGYLYGKAAIDGKPYPSKWEAILDGYNLWTEFAKKGKLDASDKGLNFVGFGQTPNATADAPGGQAAANDLITAHPDMDLLVVECDPFWPGVEVVLKQNNIVPGTDMKVVCNADGTEYGMKALKEGRILAIGNNSSAMNAIGMATIVKNIFVDGKDMNNIVNNTYTPTLAITKENVDQFYDPNKPMAGGMDYELVTVTDYNKSVSDTGDPF